MALSKAGSRWYIPLAPKGVRPGCLLRKPPDGIDRRLRALAKFVPASLFCKGAQWFIAGWSSPVARQAHNLKVIGSNPIPATTFVITHSPSRSNRRDRFSFSGERRGRATEQVRLPAALPGSSRVKGGRLFSTEHPEKLLSRALSAKEWGLRIYVEEKSSFDIFTTNLRSGVRISSGAPFRYKAGCAKPAVLGLKRRRLTRHRIRRSRPDLPILQRLQEPCRPQHCAPHMR
jgi:hypothetical protein